MKNKIVAIIFVLLFIAIVGTINFVVSKSSISGNTVLNYYSYTKAVCDNNICQDIYVSCQNGKISNISQESNPITMPKEWTDKRSIEQQNIIC